MAAAQIPPEHLQRLESLHRDRRFEDLAKQAGELTRAYPQSPLLWNILGSAHMSSRRFESARRAFEKAIALRPDYPDALNNLGLACKALDLREQAINALERAVALKPNSVEMLSNLGVAYGEAKRREESLDCLTRAIALNPNYAFAHNNLAVLFQELGRREDAIRSFDRVLELDPGNDRARTLRLLEHASLCDWDAMAPDLPRIPSLGITGEALPPSLLINIDDEPARNLVRARRNVEAIYPDRPARQHTPPPTRPARLRIGYFSADFFDHATMHLMGRLLELHDRQRFAVHAYSYSRETADKVHMRAKASVDVFRDVRELSDEEVADLAERDAIDIAIDLKGDTTDARFGIFTYRPAPVQIAYLGFPGTMGSRAIDYIVADKTVIPEADQIHFAEKPIYLPHTYQANDDKRPIADLPSTRADVGLPENGFVFCCFNNSYKITPREFDVWMGLLREVDGSVFWLLRSNPGMESNLKREAAKRGVDPARLIFAEFKPPAENLARLRLADLFLDTFACNAHTTASDALWAGLPVLTKPGNGFGARVAASLLKAIALPELIAPSVEDYEALTLALARDPARLAAIKLKLAENRLSAPLFNSTLFARHIEQAYDAAYQRYLEGKAPAVIEIPP